MNQGVCKITTTIEKVVIERVPNIAQETFSSPSALNVEKNCDFAALLKILDENAAKCTPITPLECISRCKTWKLKNELRQLRKAMENPDFMKDLMNVLKNDARIHILLTIAKGHFLVPKLQQELRTAGYSLSQDIIVEEYLRPLLEVGLAIEDQEGYHVTTFGGRIAELFEGSADIANFLPANSECNEETVLKALLSGPKTCEDINLLVSQRNVSRILRRLKTVGLVETPKERDYVFFFRSKRDPATEKFSSIESNVYKGIPDEGISVQKLAAKTEFATRTIYRTLRALKGKKLVFTRKTPKAYCLTAKGEKLATLLNALYIMVEETQISSEQVFRNNENTSPQIACVHSVPVIGAQAKASLFVEEKTGKVDRSRLETSVDILEVLAYGEQLKLTNIMHDANVDCNTLRECLDFLTQQGLVEVKSIGKERKLYAITQVGVTVLKQFSELKEVAPITA